MVRASAPGNVFLFGEHAVVYGTPAVIAATSMRTHVDLEGRPDDRVEIDSEAYGRFECSIAELCARQFRTAADYTCPLDLVRDLIKTFLEQHLPALGFRARIVSDIPRQSGGMSSSTAVLAALLQALNLHYGAGLQASGFFDWLYPFQVKIHGGSASGAEIVSSALGGYNQVRIQRASGTARLESEHLADHHLHLVIGNTNVEAATKHTVPYVREGWERAPGDYEAVFQQIASVTEQGRAALVAGQAEEVGKLMDLNHEILARDLGVSHPKLNRLVDAARRAGALGAKMSGGGKGGIMVALVTADTKEKVAAAITEAGGQPFIVQVGVPGVDGTAASEDLSGRPL
eukprot:EG_transcript_16291